MNEIRENGYLIHWYNLHEDIESEYLEWLHENIFRHVSKTQGFCGHVTLSLLEM